MTPKKDLKKEDLFMTTSTRRVSQGMMMMPILDMLMQHRDEGPQKISVIVSECLRDLGLPLDVIGVKDGRPLVFQTFANAGMELRGKDCIRSVGRAWEITDAGLEAVKTRVLPPRVVKPVPAAPKPPAAKAKPPAAKAKPPAAKVSPEPAPEKPRAKPGPKPKPKAEAPKAEAPKAETGQKPKLMVLSGETPAPTEEWVKDPTIAALVAANTPCFGTYSPGASACGKCPIRTSCASLLATGLRAIADGLVLESQNKASFGIPLRTATSNAAVALEPNTPRAVMSNLTVRKLRVTVEGALCSRSGKALSTGTECLYVKGVGLIGLGEATAEEKRLAENALPVSA